MHVAEKGTRPPWSCVTDSRSPGIRGGIRSRRYASRFHAVAPDIVAMVDRRPQAIDQSTLLHLVGNVVGLLDALRVEPAAIAGHDCGAPVAWHALCYVRNSSCGDRLERSLQVTRHIRTSTTMPRTDDAIFCQQYFQYTGVAEADLELDVQASIRSVLLSLAERLRLGQDGVVDSFSMVPREGGLLVELCRITRSLSSARMANQGRHEFYADELRRAGFSRGLNSSQNIDRKWELLSPSPARVWPFRPFMSRVSVIWCSAFPVHGT